MMRKIKLLTLYSLPFIAVALFHCLDTTFLTAITGNAIYSVFITFSFLFYFLTIIGLNGTWKSSPIAILTILILSIVFLPVRKDISIIDYITQGDKIYWIERHYISGEIVVYSGNMQPLTKRSQVYVIDETTHGAYLDFNSDGNLILAFSKAKSPEKYQHIVILDNQ
jgi:hypothetical protein